MEESDLLVDQPEKSKINNKTKKIVVAALSVLFILAGIFLIVYFVDLRGNDRNYIPEFGKKMRKEWFVLDPDCLYINHGSYGASPSKFN